MRDNPGDRSQKVLLGFFAVLSFDAPQTSLRMDLLRHRHGAHASANEKWAALSGQAATPLRAAPKARGVKAKARTEQSPKFTAMSIVIDTV
jgi:hypothetical protein